MSTIKDEAEFDQQANDLLFLLRRFGQNRGMTDKQIISLALWVLSLAIKADIEVNGDNSGKTFKKGLKGLIQEIDEMMGDIVKE